MGRWAFFCLLAGGLLFGQSAAPQTPEATRTPPAVTGPRLGWADIAKEVDRPHESFAAWVGRILSEYADENPDSRTTIKAASRIAAQESIENFAAIHAARGRDLASSDYGYWCAYCWLEACRREQASDKKVDASLALYEAQLRSIGDELVRERLRNWLGEEPYLRWKVDIDKGIDEFVADGMEYIERCRSDLLCPFFRKVKGEDDLREPSELPRLVAWVEGRKYLLEGYAGAIPADERRRTSLHGFFRGPLLGRTMFEIAHTELTPALKVTEYWGHMSWQFTSCYAPASTEEQLVWPIDLKIHPNEDMNRAMGLAQRGGAEKKAIGATHSEGAL